MPLTIAVLKEQFGETRVAATPDSIKKFVKLGAKFQVESGAGEASGIFDDEFKEAGAKICKNSADACKGAYVLFKIGKPTQNELSSLKKDAIVIGLLSPLESPEEVNGYAKAKVEAYAMELLPRTSRAQSMDILSSQSNLAGYRAVIDASHELNKAVPLMMTSAGTVVPVRAFILGAGVAGLQAIATAKRLGAIVSATDVRAAARDEVESLGAEFVMVDMEESGDAEGGYAKEMSAEYKKKQQELVDETVKSQDMIICTALIPGKKAPVLVTDAMLKTMKPGSVVVDLAASHGGNCEGSKPDEIVEKHGVKIIGYKNVARRCSVDASGLFARNLYNFLSPFIKEGELEINYEDDLIQGTLLTKDGKVVHERLIEAKPKKTPAKKKPAAKKKAAPKKETKK